MNPLRQEQFLDVLDRDEAERRFRAVLDLRPLGSEEVPLAEALGRVLARDVTAGVDVPAFDRANVDGFAVRAEDTFGASEEVPRRLRLNDEVLAPGVVPQRAVTAGTATPIATGGVVPRGADAVLMVEQTDTDDGILMVRRPVTPGANITFAGSDIGRGETVLRRGDYLTSRETGVLAALGRDRVEVVRRPRVAIISTGDELVPPGGCWRPGAVFDSNATVLADAVRELGGQPLPLGIVPDDAAALAETLRRALAAADLVLLSGGTSKGAGDLSYRVVAELGPPGILAHGVALKPGKPLCLAAVQQAGRVVPVVILPGFPTSAIFTFREFVAPVLRAWAGRRPETSDLLTARLPMRINSERGRTEYLLVSLVGTGPPGAPQAEWCAYPLGKGSGSVTAFARADGFVIIPRHREYLEAGEQVEVHLLGHGLRPADLVVIGSHCVGLDILLGRVQEVGFASKFLAVGSHGGLEAARRGECDLAGIHLLDPVTNVYNRPFVTPELELVPGYGRLQGIVFRRGDARFEGRSLDDVLARVRSDPGCVLVNRNRGSGTRVLLDRLLGDCRPAGYLAEVRSHQAVAAAVAQGRADWGVAISTVARDLDLGFLPLQEERYDFVVPKARWDRPAVRAFRAALEDAATRRQLARCGFVV
ncbi:MAG: molybdopterin biosynthesis protein [Gemmataceae bacterium]|nr:molybdopterin biosynthesis protein [Gemmataceae bacterium]MDW8267322.1 molybdopterin biosynthesis protein [Gemmataceae bacterium]